MKKIILLLLLLIVLTGCDPKICWECYDGDTDCNRYDEPLRKLAEPDAETFCEGKCNVQNEKCGVNGITVPN
ncbi:lipoprotein [Candidatus Woesearchaeota archaeon]|jgi:hypothetical protein|nr:lipoprotein [Candidatus Woesearchaeota archaeon]MBT4150556.1 lipoprotein [Candidatus Woesearchaeota archaeon]MBT7331951.1 lipoprotein [Candidatus Woesearchaeota archaeon]